MEIQSGAVSPVGSIEEGWKIIKDDYWTFFGMSIVAMIILIVAALILGFISNLIVFAVSAALGVAANGGGDAARMSASIIPQVVSMFVSFFTNIIVGTLSGALFCGIYKALSRKSMGEVADFGDLFAGFGNIQSCLIIAVAISVAQFLISAISIAIAVVFGVSAVGLGMIGKDTTPSASMIGGMIGAGLLFLLFIFVANLLVSILTTFSYPLIGERELSGGEALKLSAKGGLANFGGLILLMILLALMSLVGLAVCFVGIFFVFPVVLAALFAAYQSVFGRPRAFEPNMPPPPPNFGNQPQAWG